VKSVNFKPKSSTFRVLNEEVKDKKTKRINWDRLFYFIFFGAILIGLGLFLGRRYLYVRANGLVLFQNVSIRIAQDARLDSLMRVEGDSVRIGDTLFIYSKLNEKASSLLLNAGLNPVRKSSQDWKIKEKFNVEMEISENNVQIKTDENLLKEFKGELKGLENQVALGLLPVNRIESVKTEILKLQGNIQKLKAANAQLRSFMGQLNTTAIDSSDMNTGFTGMNNDTISSKIPFLSPITGTLSRTFFYQFEVAPKNDIIMSLQKDSNSFVRAYFKQEDWSYVKVGDAVDLSFPDGTVCKGEIRKIYSSTFALPPELQLQYEPVQRMVVGDIYPLMGSENCSWNVISRSGVKVSKSKYW